MENQFPFLPFFSKEEKNGRREDGEEANRRKRELQRKVSPPPFSLCAPPSRPLLFLAGSKKREERKELERERERERDCTLISTGKEYKSLCRRGDQREKR